MNTEWIIIKKEHMAIVKRYPSPEKARKQAETLAKISGEPYFILQILEEISG